ncbi:hypothetical protein RB49ORF192c [Escherichia phage RB49]|uniref:Uncharacterized protein n=1 Tax=Escherichia phage RB49 TaxID=50948 RepID=Q7Y3L4_BPRB4|nr:hypothetical protein RB49p192 [Escherichia phage RB49]AAQ15421.1 hypothetical protein RB49ORF192c [Escherichia phage RB49]
MKKIIAIAVVAALSMTNVAHAAKKKVAPLFDMTQEKIENVDKTYQCDYASEVRVQDGEESKARDAYFYKESELKLKTNEDGTMTAVLRNEFKVHKNVMTFDGKGIYSNTKEPFFQYIALLHNRFDKSLVNGYVTVMIDKDDIRWIHYQHDKKITVWCK